MSDEKVEEDRVCAGCGTKTGTRLACPSCVKLKQREPLYFEKMGKCREVDYFCSQECFKKNWSEHKLKHKPWAQDIENDPAKMPDVFRGYTDFTGSLRPYARASTTIELLQGLPASLMKPDYWQSGDPISEKESKKAKGIRVYNEKEINGIRKACQIGREVLDACGNAVKAGVTTAEIDRICYEACLERNAYPSPLNYFHFPCSVCTSVNEVICHGIPDLRELEQGDIVNIDVSVYVNGFHGDLNETYLVGKVDPDSLNVVETAFRSLQVAASLIKPGAMYRDIGNAIEKFTRTRNCSVVKTYCGHGIGSLFHTAPNVPHYAKNKATGIMKPGHIFTIEPMINLGTWRDKTWPDNWTAVTTDGKRSAQFEHTFLVTNDGVEILTMRHNEPTMIWDVAKQQR
mmetsp:Transcript_4237/g.5975  ORF Transcript_4237/g.5975 Transcript_4237/m.5975 type:complete len:401 (+) Transcript_4237:3-1205(+)